MSRGCGALRSVALLMPLDMTRRKQVQTFMYRKFENKYVQSTEHIKQRFKKRIIMFKPPTLKILPQQCFLSGGCCNRTHIHFVMALILLLN